MLDDLAGLGLPGLLPALAIGACMSDAIPEEAITRFSGPKAKKWISWAAGAVGG